LLALAGYRTGFAVAISSQDRRFLVLCEEVREGSHDPDRKVGVVISDDGDRLLAVGTNAPPASLCLTAAQSAEAIGRDPAWKYFMLEHAERNAIYTAYAQGKSLKRATMYGTLFPCADCARAIAATGITRLVIPGVERDPVRDEKWLEHYRYAEQVLALAGVVVEIVDPIEAA
jgi:dCMP deaminase